VVATAIETFLVLFIGICLLVTCSTNARSQTYYPVDSLSVAWDVVTVPAGSTVDYRVYTRFSTQTPADAVLRSTVSVPAATVSFASEGRYFIGIQAVRKVSGTEVSSSTVSWSDVSANCQGGVTFGAVYYTAPSAPTGLRKQ
jgi:hypothetical protein